MGNSITTICTQEFKSRTTKQNGSCRPVSIALFAVVSLLKDVEVLAAGHLLVLLLAQLVGKVLEALHLLQDERDAQRAQLHQQLHVLLAEALQPTAAGPALGRRVGRCVGKELVDTWNLDGKNSNILLQLKVRSHYARKNYNSHEEFYHISKGKKCRRIT